MKHKVGIVACNSYDSEKIFAALTALLQLIDFDKISEGQNVLIKPNIICPLPPERAATTHPSIIDAVCRILKEKKVNIIIGESSGSVLYGGTRNAFAVSGIEAAAKKWGAEILPFEAAKIVETSIDGRILKTIPIPKPVADADIIINLPKLKTHTFMRYTGAVKNMLGVIPGGRKHDYHGLAGNEERFGELLIDIYQKIPPHLSIMDGIVGMEGNGPTMGTRKNAGLLVASTDALALDMAVSRMIGFEPYDIATHRAARKRGIIPAFELRGEINSTVNFEKPRSFVPFFLRHYLEGFFVSTVAVDGKQCGNCFVCIEACPVHAITKNKNAEHPVVNQSQCISCYTCHELCVAGAMKLKKSWIERLAMFILRRKARHL